jgi:hypothetical protein
LVQVFHLHSNHQRLTAQSRFPTESPQWANAELAGCERLRQRLLDGRSEEAYFAEAERIGPYLTLLRGMSFERENLQWGDMALRRLEQRTAALRADG